MKIAFLVNELRTECEFYDTTLLSYTAAHMGHDVYVMEVGDLSYYEDGHMGAKAVKAPKKKFKTQGNYLKHIQGKDAEIVTITSRELDVLYLRSNPSEDTGPRVWAQYAGVVFAKIALAKGVMVLNDPYGLPDIPEKMYFEHFPQKVRPQTIITRDKQQIHDFYDKHEGKVVVKPLQGSGGTDVFLLDEITNLNQIVEAINRNGFVICQEYLKEATDGDTRIIVMNGKILEVNGKYAAIHRKNAGGDIRSNIHVGGKAVKAQITDKMFELVELIKPKFLQDGVFIAGIDVVGDKIMEVNLFSPGCLYSAEMAEGEKFAQAQMHAIERKLEYKKYYGDRLTNRELAVLD